MMNFRAGEIMSAVRVEILDEEERSYDIVSNLFVREKPVEVRRGVVRLSQLHSLPAEIENTLLHADGESSLPVPLVPSQIHPDRIFSEMSHWVSFSFQV